MMRRQELRSMWLASSIWAMRNCERLWKILERSGWMRWKRGIRNARQGGKSHRLDAIEGIEEIDMAGRIDIEIGIMIATEIEVIGTGKDLAMEWISIGHLDLQGGRVIEHDRIGVGQGIERGVIGPGLRVGRLSCVRVRLREPVLAMAMEAVMELVAEKRRMVRFYGFKKVYG